MNSKDYPFIVVWGRYHGELPLFTEIKVMQARQQDAPERAIFKYQERWVTVDELPNPEVIEMFEERVEAERVK